MTNRKQIAKQYVDKYLKPKLIDLGVFDRSIIFISGSVAYGFDDELSDIEIEYFVQNCDVSEAKKLNLPKEFQNIRISADYVRYEYDSLLDDNIKDFFKVTNTYSLSDITRSIVLEDTSHFWGNIISKIQFYPKDILIQHVRGLWLQINDSGLYNADYSYRRKNYVESEILFWKAFHRLVNLIFLLNGEYYPHPKWLMRFFKKLDNKFGFDRFSDFYKMQLDERLDIFKQIEKNIEVYLLNLDLLPKDEVNSPWSILAKEYKLNNTF